MMLRGDPAEAHSGVATADVLDADAGYTQRFIGAAESIDERYAVLVAEGGRPRNAAFYRNVHRRRRRRSIELAFDLHRLDYLKGRMADAPGPK